MSRKDFVLERPGRLQSKVILHLHTVDGQTLYAGLQGGRAIGLLQFTQLVTAIWEAAEKDDPYADWMLLKIYDAAVRLRRELGAVIKIYEKQLHQMETDPDAPRLPFGSERPLKKELWFRTQYSYMAANLIAQFDRLMRIVLTAQRIGLLLDKSHQELRDHWRDQIANLFKLPLRWQNTGLTRELLSKNKELANKAKSNMGKLPDAVLKKELRAPFSPTISTSSGTT